MSEVLSQMGVAHATVLAAIPLVYLVVAARAELASRAAVPWRAAEGAAALAFGAALVAFAGCVVEGPGLWRGPVVWALGDAGDLRLSLRHDLPGAVMLALVTFIGWVVTRFARAYLGTAPGTARFVRGLMVTLAAVCVLVLSNNLAVLACAWTMTSLGLHTQLTFFPERQAALVAAHKKFLASRAAELFLISGFTLLALRFGSLEIDVIGHELAGLRAPRGMLEAAGVLIALGALVKCAQLPVHGWLMQVMEAPTPVSALLHAGVVNLGGFVVIRLADVVAASDAAMALLVICGTSTAVFAATAAATRISVKVALAWSTCAQMGFMLMQCGLGLHGLALLHLVGHSLYKAHAFLSAGSVVHAHRVAQLLPPAPAATLRAWAAAALTGAACVTVAGVLYGLAMPPSPAVIVPGFVLALALARLIAAGHATGLPAVSAATVGASLVTAGLYFALHGVFRHVVTGGHAGAPPLALTWFVIAAFGSLFVLQAWCATLPGGRIPARLHAALFSGAWLDEWFTRVTFRWWPAPAPARAARAHEPQTQAQE